jgi:hypothetical protein
MVALLQILNQSEESYVKHLLACANLSICTDCIIQHFKNEFVSNIRSFTLTVNGNRPEGVIDKAEQDNRNENIPNTWSNKPRVIAFTMTTAYRLLPLRDLALMRRI